MTVIIKVGRRIHRNINKSWFRNQIGKMQNTLSIQQYMWRTILYGFKLSIVKMKHEIKQQRKKGQENFSFTKRTYTETESMNYDIEWFELLLKGSEQFERDEYNSAMKFFSKIKELPKFKNKNIEDINIDKDLTKEYEGKLKKGKKYIEKGLEKVKELTIAKTLNDVGIIVLIENEENK